MNYLQQVINLSNENLTIESTQDLLEIIKKINPVLLNNTNLIFPFPIAENPAFKPVSWKYVLANHKHKEEIINFLENKQSKDLVYWDSQNKNIVLAISVREINEKIEFETQEKRDFLSQFYEQIKTLTQELPTNIEDINALIFKYSGDGNTEKSFLTPAIKLIEILKDINVLEIFFKNYPSIKDYFDINNNYYTQKNMRERLVNNFNNGNSSSYKSSLYSQFAYTFSINQYDDRIKGYTASLGLVNGLMQGDIQHYIDIYKDKKTNTKNPDILKRGLIYLISNNQVDALKSIFQNNKNFLEAFKIEAQTATVGNHMAQYVRDKEMLNLLIDLDIPVFYHRSNVINNTQQIENYLSFNEVRNEINRLVSTNDIGNFSYTFIPYFHSDGKRAVNAIELLVDLLPELNTSSYLNKYAESLFLYNSANDYKYIYEKLPGLNYGEVDIFYNLIQKNVDNLDLYKEAIDNGYNPRNCRKFIEYACKNSLGPKIIRGLNKEGLVVAKNPDYVFNTYKYSTTKNLTSLFDKTPDEIFNKYTVDGYPAWWGALSKETLIFTSSKAFDVTQTAKNGQNVFQYFMHIFCTETHKFSEFANIIAPIVAQMENKNFKFDFSVPNPETGNNFFHDLFTVNYNNKGKISDIEALVSIADDKFLTYIDTPNFGGVYPIDILIECSNDKNKYEAKRNLSQLIYAHRDNISFTRKNKDGLIIGDLILDLLNDKNDELVALIEERMMHEELERSNKNTSVRIQKTHKF